LHWNKRTHEIYTDKKIKITTPYETLEGFGMTSNEQFSKYKVWQPTGTFLVKDGEQAIPSDTSAIARQKRSTLNLTQLRQQNASQSKKNQKYDPRLLQQFKNKKDLQKSTMGSGIFSKKNLNLDSLRKVRRDRIKGLKKTNKTKLKKDKK